MKKRVVVTGMGVVSPIGIGVAAFSKSLEGGVSGAGPITSFDPAQHPFKRAYEVKNFDDRRYGTHQLDPFIQYAVWAAAEAFENAGFDPSRVDPYRIALSVSSSKGGVHTIDRFKERFRLRPSAILGARIYANLVPNFGAQWIARRWKIQGPAKCYVAACATGTVAIEQGAHMIADGAADYCLAGASDASIVPLMLAGYHQMGALAAGPMLPFHRERSGFLVGEGAGILFLESLESAQARGVKIYGEVLGAACGSDGTHALHFNPAENALSRTVKNLLTKIGRNPRDISYVNLHGTATQAGDLYETGQMRKVFCRDTERVPMSSTKSLTGHMLGASGAVEAIACLLALDRQFLPPTAGLDKPDPECGGLDLVALKSRHAKVETALSVSMGFGGHIAAISFAKV